MRNLARRMHCGYRIQHRRNGIRTKSLEIKLGVVFSSDR